MIARVADHGQPPTDLNPEDLERFRAWMAAQPGFCGGYHLIDDDSGNAVSVTLWEDADALLAAGRVMRENGPRTERRPSGGASVRIMQVAAVF